jgi:proteic killer suppression protein
MRGYQRGIWLEEMGRRAGQGIASMPAVTLADLSGLPSNRLEARRGDRAGQYSIRIHQQWRICFEWPEPGNGLSNVEIVDYHQVDGEQ